MFLCAIALVAAGAVFVDCNNGSTGGSGGEDDLSVWTTVGDSIFGDSGINGVAWGGDKFVAVGSGGKIAYWNGIVE